MKTCIITACTGNYKAHLRSIDHLNIDGFIFGDIKDENLKIDGNRWNRIQKSFFHHRDPFILAKYYKCFWNQIPMLDQYDTIVWIDSTIQIKSLPYDLIRQYELITYAHPLHNNTHREIEASFDIRYQPYKLGLDKQKNQQQINWLALTCFIMMKRCTNIYLMNNLWFSDILRYSPQDQVSFPRACETSGVVKKIITPDDRMTSATENEHYIKHRHLLPKHRYLPGDRQVF